MEDFGPEKRKQLATSLYYSCITRGIFTSTQNNRSTADLKPNKSREFLTELEKACNKVYFGRFSMYLGNELAKKGIYFTGDFTCKWSLIEDSLFKAIGDEQNVIRLSNFLDLNHTQFKDQPLELLFNQVNHEVDSYLGRQVVKDSKDRSQCLATHALLMKYSLIFDIVRNLGGNFILIKELILKEVSKLYFDVSKLLDIPDFQVHLLTIMEQKSLSTQYRTENVSLSKKHLPVHAAGVKTDTKVEETPEQKE